MEALEPQGAPMNGRASLTNAIRLGVVACVAIAQHSVAAQTVTGRVTDTLGIPIPHANILAHPLGDSTEAATRMAVTNVQGEFRIQVPGQAVYVIRVRRIGFVGEKDQTLDLTRARDAKLAIVLRAVPVEINAVRVAAKAPKTACLAMDDSLQNPIVREWFDRAIYWIRARRVLERSLSYKVQVTRVMTPAPRTSSPVNSYTHRPGTGMSLWLEDEIASVAVVARNDVMPTEMTLVAPLFRANYCFANAVKPSADGTWLIEFRDLVAHQNTPTVTGMLFFAADGLALDSAGLRFANDGRPVSSAHLRFSRATIEGEPYPILIERGVTHLPSPDSRQATSRVERFTYSAYSRGR